MYPDAIDVLEGRVTILEGEFSPSQQMAYIDALNNALYEFWPKGKGIYLRDVIDDLPENWNEMTDNYLAFLMENFIAEVRVYGVIMAWRGLQMDFDSTTDTFEKFFEDHHTWIS